MDLHGNTQTLSFDAGKTAIKSDILEAENMTAADFPHHNSELLVARLKQLPGLAALYDSDARVYERYTIEEHTLMVLGQFEKYFASVEIPGPLGHQGIKIALALHDIGKPIPANIKDQHGATLAVLESIRHALPFNEAQWNAMIQLVDGDPLGEYVKGFVRNAPEHSRRKIGELSETRPLLLDEIRDVTKLAEVKFSEEIISDLIKNIAPYLKTKAKIAGMSPADFLRIQLIYYQCDTTAYTYDAAKRGGQRAWPSLEALYELNDSFTLEGGQALFISDPESGLLRFISPIQEAMMNLAQAINEF